VPRIGYWRRRSPTLVYWSHVTMSHICTMWMTLPQWITAWLSSMTWRKINVVIEQNIRQILHGGCMFCSMTTHLMDKYQRTEYLCGPRQHIGLLGARLYRECILAVSSASGSQNEEQRRIRHYALSLPRLKPESLHAVDQAASVYIIVRMPPCRWCDQLNAYEAWTTTKQDHL